MRSIFRALIAAGNPGENCRCSCHSTNTSVELSAFCWLLTHIILIYLKHSNHKTFLPLILLKTFLYLYINEHAIHVH